jgi:predicted alpha-1,2-mannosidase
MNRKWIIALLLGLLPLVGHGQEAGADVLQYVDPTIGGVSVLLQPTRPTIHLPNQMIRMVPSRADMLDDWIADYPLTMVSHRLESVFGLLPFCSQTLDNLWDAKAECDHEVFHPYEYKADLEGATFEFAPSRKSGIVRVCFEGAGHHVFRLRTLNPSGSYALQGRRVVTGEASFEGMKAYLYAEFDADLTSAVPADHSDRLLLETQASRVMMRYGLSYISVAQARENLSREIPAFDFDQVCRAARAVWAQRLGQIQAGGGTKAHLRTFYTALYRCSERMVDINEYGHYYSAYDHQVHASDKPFYVDNWIWDMHIALEPLQTILNPAMEVDKINSYIEMYKQGGVMPSFAITTGDWPAMTGNYAAAWMADAWAKGLRFDLPTAYKGLRANSLDATLLPWCNGPRTAIDDFYNQRGYYPALRPDEKEYHQRGGHHLGASAVSLHHHG